MRPTKNGLAYTVVRRRHARITCCQCKSGQVKDKNAVTVYVKNWCFFFSDSPTKKNSKTTCVLRRHMRSSALYAQVICAHMCRLRHLSTTNGLGAMERRSKKNRFFKKYMLAQKTYFPTSIQKALWHDYGRYLDTSTCVIRIWYVVG